MTLSVEFPEAYKELLRTKDILETHYKAVCEIDFTIENGALHVLSAHRARMSSKAKITSAIDLFLEGKITLYDAISSIDPEAVQELLRTEITNKDLLQLVGKGCASSPGLATGNILLRNGSTDNRSSYRHQFIYVTEKVTPEDIQIIFAANGVLTTSGGKASHAAIVARGMGKPCVTGFEELNIDQFNRLLIFGNNERIAEGDWLTIDGTDGSVFIGEAEIIHREWRSIYELKLLYQMVRHAAIKRSPPFYLMGLVWLYWDFFLHRRPLLPGVTKKKAVDPSRKYISFAQPHQSRLQEYSNALITIPSKFTKDFGRMIIGLTDALQRLLSGEVGIGKHHKYYRPLWDPGHTLKTEINGNINQLIGFEFFDISKYIRHLPDIFSAVFHVLVSLSSEEDGWFLDYTNPEGESLVANANDVVAYNLFINGAIVGVCELPCFYNIVRRREYVQSS